MSSPRMKKGKGNDDQASLEARTSFSGDAANDGSIGSYFQGYVNKVRGGDVGALPAVLGLVVLVVVFWIAKPGSDGFPTVYNFANLLQQAGSIIVLAMGLGFVLLLGHIDLSAGLIGGVSAAVMAELMLEKGLGLVLRRAGGHRRRRADGHAHRLAGHRRRYPVVRGDPCVLPGLAGCAAAHHR